jgi:hypothetical protein
MVLVEARARWPTLPETCLRTCLHRQRQAYL